MGIRFCRQLQCQNTVGTYTCGCRQGFERVVADNLREYACADIDECLNKYTCPKNAVCQNQEGDYKCICDSGFEGETCSDTDECSISNTTCDANADCKNTPGDFECACRKGFFGTGQECVKGQCQDSVCADNKRCTSLTTISCICKDGFVSGLNDTCKDLDECSSTNDCDINAKCINVPGSFLCECADGFYGNGITCLPGDCIESDCPANEQCVNPRRSDCECKEGFYRDESNSCVDVDECEATNNCHQNAACSNTEGSYYCACETGFFGTGFSCLEGMCNDAFCPGNRTCSSPTSSCNCPEGLEKNGTYCFDIDECSRGTHDCLKRSYCVNEVKTYSCTCLAGYNDKRTINDQIHCTNLDLMVCHLTDQVFECACKDGFNENVDGTCTDIDECIAGTHDCSKDSTCVNDIGNFICDVDECAFGIHNCASGVKCINTYASFTCEE